MSPAGEPFHEEVPGHAAVRGFLHRAARAGADGLVLTHGAGGDCNAPLLVALAAAFAEAGFTVLRCDLPYRQERHKGPPSPAGAARDRDGLRQAARAVRGMVPGRVFLGGQSYGGRQASVLLAEAPELADALVLLSYPLHPPGRAREQRTAHFPRLHTPALFVHGSLDPFGSLEELDAARALIGGTTAVLAVQGAGHGLGRGARRPQPAAGTVDAVVKAFLAFVGVQASRRG